MGLVQRASGKAALVLLFSLIMISGHTLPLYANESAEGQSTNPLNLTNEEKQWLKEHPVIRAQNESNWRPFNFRADGKPQGFSISFLTSLQKE